MLKLPSLNMVREILWFNREAREDATLEEAAVHKLDMICCKLDLQPGDRVVEIGTGWCGFAIHAASLWRQGLVRTTGRLW